MRMEVKCLLINRGHRQYIKLPKPSEWQNDLWKIWEFFKTYLNVEIVSENDFEYDDILKHDRLNWNDFDNSHLKRMHPDKIVNISRELVYGSDRALFVWMLRREVELNKLRDL